MVRIVRSLVFVVLGIMTFDPPVVADAGPKNVITILENETVPVGVDLPPIDVSRFSRIFILGYAASGSGSLTVTFATDPVAFGEPGAKVQAGSCEVNSIAAVCQNIGGSGGGFDVGGRFLAIRLNVGAGTNVLTLKLHGVR